MHHTLLSSLTIAFLLTSTSAFAFLDNLDDLEKQIDAVDTEETSESGQESDILDEIMNELQGVEYPNKTLVTFSDVPKDAWFHDYVFHVANLGIVSGYKDAEGNPSGQYGPGDPVTVAQMLKIAMEAAQKDTSACPDNVTTESANGHWAQSYVACGEVMEMRVLDGNTDINRPALRGEVLGIIHDVYRDNVDEAENPFTDTVGHAYEADITYAASKGIVSGDKDVDGNLTGTFRPNDGVNRAEAAKIIYMRMEMDI